MKALEIGLDYGYSSVRIARLLPEGGKLFSLDPSTKKIEISMEIVEFAGLSDKV